MAAEPNPIMPYLHGHMYSHAKAFINAYDYFHPTKAEYVTSWIQSWNTLSGPLWKMFTNSYIEECLKIEKNIFNFISIILCTCVLVVKAYIKLSVLFFASCGKYLFLWWTSVLFITSITARVLCYVDILCDCPLSTSVFTFVREKGMAIHSYNLDWKIPWTEEPGGPSPRGHKELDMTKCLTLLLL